MRRFILTTLVVLVTTLLGLGLLTYSQSPKYYNLWNIVVTQKHEIASGKQKIDPPDILAIGNSQMYGGFIPEMIPNSYNLAIPGTAITEHYYLVKKYLENYPAPRVMILGLFPQNEYYFHYSFWNLHVRFGAYNVSETLEVLKEAIDTNNFLMFKSSNGLYKDTFDYLVRAVSLKLYFPNENQDYLRKIVTFTPARLDIQRIRELHNFQNGFFNFNADNKVDFLLQYLLEGKRIERNDTFIIEPLYYSYLKKFMELINKHNITLVCVTMPRATTLTQKIGEKTIRESEIFFKNFFGQYPNTVYIEDRFNMEDTDFLDSHHFSYNGAIKFSEKLKNAMAAKGLFNPLSQSEKQ